MSALTDEKGAFRLVEDETPQQITARRRKTMRMFDTVLPPSQYEVDAYRAAGLEPPKD